MSTAIAIVSVVIALVASAFAFGSWRRDRRHRVRVEQSSTRLVQPGNPELEIKLRGLTPLKDPHSATITLTAQKPHDVDPEAFAGKALRVEFGAQVMTVTALDGHPDGAAFIQAWREQFYEGGSGLLRQQRPPWPTYVDLPPALLSVNAPWSLTVLCDGAPEPDVSGYLIDTDWIKGRRDTGRQGYFAGLFGGALAALLAGGLTAGLASLAPLALEEIDATVVAAAATLVSLIAILAVLILRGLRR